MTIPAEKRDKGLTEKLRAEWPAILRWALDGCLEWRRQGLNPPAAVRDATENYLTSEDIITQWIEECCVVSKAGSTRSSVLYRSYAVWAEQAHEFILSQKRFSQEMEERGFTIRRSHCSFVDNIWLRAEEGQEET